MYLKQLENERIKAKAEKDKKQKELGNLPQFEANKVLNEYPLRNDVRLSKLIQERRKWVRGQEKIHEQRKVILDKELSAKREKEKFEELERLRLKESEENREIEIESSRLKMIEDENENIKNKFKEKIKQEILRKEKEKIWASEAYQELIDIGEINSNEFSGKNTRESIPTDVKIAVWHRDKECCVKCNSKSNLEFDHIIPVSKGGANSINNIQILCRTCNRKKSNKII